ncbi:c-type cytochrome [Aquamicrobium sp. cd-1]|uniref:C-type cytochrome n=2 Tax=Aquamicrobium zhengzhouense TaxID=2781738 RepID=A0ABS0SDG3_9HYPH|nr:c-type cytochrome [Aquamicrobium zhengzhouense]
MLLIMPRILLALSASALFLAAVLPAQSDPAQIRAGERVFRNQCLGCHSIKENDHRAGPTLHQLFGRQSGSMEGFDYSPAMREAGIEWSPETLDVFLAAPKETVPGTKMVFWGLDERQRGRVIAYLQSQQD